jgi:hypothetical protein
MTTQPPQLPQCPMFETPNCRFFSFETQIIPYAPMIEDPRTGRLQHGSIMHKKVMAGTGCFCNNVGSWVSELTYCPARWALHGVASSGRVADGTGVYTEPVVVPSILFRED